MIVINWLIYLKKKKDNLSLFQSLSPFIDFMASTDMDKIHEVTKVFPPSLSATEISLPLTMYDTLWFKFHPVERLFFYQITDLAHHFFYSEIIPKLKQSLSLTLSHYLPLAGHLIWPQDAPKPFIYYSSNDGVSVTVAESTADFTRLSGNGIRDAVELRPLTPELLTSDDKAAVISIQITLFPNQGFCIGLSSHHAVLDGKSATMFIKSWSYLCKQSDKDANLLLELIPSFDRTVIKDPTGIDMAYINNWFSFTKSDPKKRSLKVLQTIGGNPNRVRATFQLSRDDIKKLRNKVLSMVEQNTGKQSKQLHLSTFVLTCAYVFVCLVKAKGGEDNRGTMLGFAADYRSRLEPPVPANYVGNCVMSHAMVATKGDYTKEDGVAFVAEKLSDMIRGIERGELEGTKETLENYIEMMKSVPGGIMLGLAGSIQFDVYGSDFGWGRPKKVEIVSIDRGGAIGLAKSRDESGGVEVGLVLEKQEMEAFASLFVDGLKN
ncbi:phenolic glucoside malonyltransferase 1-like [Mangifera indica]|uniref:phenolic glucoside malonyltransferase 1-like n=1 Tax=Mangifera indica TaxID=29780 RepID=UPI001CF9C2E4|nr:phenolic glucoside malonyltransferase 1-like [Mangifera indica]